MTLFIFMLLIRLTTNLFILIISCWQTICTYLSSHLLYSQIYTFINQLVPFVCVFHLALHALIFQVICCSAYRQTHPKMNVPVNFDASGYNHKDLPANSTAHTCTRSKPFSHSFFCIYSGLPPQSTCPPNYCSTYIQIYPEINLPLYHDPFLPANHKHLPVD